MKMTLGVFCNKLRALGPQIYVCDLTWALGGGDARTFKIRLVQPSRASVAL